MGNVTQSELISYSRLTTGLQGSLGGSPGANSVGTTQIKAGGVGSQNIASNAVYAPKIAANSVGYGKITTGLQGSLGLSGADSIGTTELKEPGVGSQNIMDDAIGSRHIQNDAIGSSAMIGAGVIRGYNLANNTIGSQQLANGAVIGTKIANYAVGSQQLDSPGRGPYPGLEEYKFAEHYEHGTITGVRSAGRYKSFTDYFTNMHVVVGAVGTYHACLALPPAVGSFKVRVFTLAGLSGTADVHYHAWGNRI